MQDSNPRRRVRSPSGYPDYPNRPLPTGSHLLLQIVGAKRRVQWELGRPRLALANAGLRDGVLGQPHRWHKVPGAESVGYDLTHEAEAEAESLDSASFDSEPEPAEPAEPDNPEPQPEADAGAEATAVLPACCQKAVDAGGECDHPCCVEARAKGEICAKCSNGA